MMFLDVWTRTQRNSRSLRIFVCDSPTCSTRTRGAIDESDLKIFLERLFDCKVDLVIADAVKPRLRKPIFEETIYAQGL